uniref:Uncharacterized protein n=1 Tax=Anser brachyrhynchus TaxID=132585 RepID=A0A8B9C9W1_9AVES
MDELLPSRCYCIAMGPSVPILPLIVITCQCFKFPCLFCLQNSNTRYLELHYPQLCSPGKKAARLNLYERSPDCRHCCLYSQRQSAAMVWESTTVKIVSQAPLNHCCMQIFVHTIMKEVWHKSLNFHLSPHK